MSRALGCGGETVLSVGGGTLRGWSSVTCREWGGELSSVGGGLGGGPVALGVEGVGGWGWGGWGGVVWCWDVGWGVVGVSLGWWGYGGGSGRSEVFEVSKRSF